MRWEGFTMRARAYILAARIRIWKWGQRWNRSKICAHICQEKGKEKEIAKERKNQGGYKGFCFSSKRLRWSRASVRVMRIKDQTGHVSHHWRQPVPVGWKYVNIQTRQSVFVVAGNIPHTVTQRDVVCSDLGDSAVRGVYRETEGCCLTLAFGTRARRKEIGK